MRWCLFCSGVPAPDRIFIIETEVESGAKWRMGGRESKHNMRQEGMRAPEEERMEKGTAGARASDAAGRNQPREQKAASYEKGGFCKNRVELGVRAAECFNKALFAREEPRR